MLVWDRVVKLFGECRRVAKAAITSKITRIASSETIINRTSVFMGCLLDRNRIGPIIVG